MASSIKLSAIEKGTGPTLLLVPGWSQSAKGYQAQIDGLSDRYRVIAVDMRGHGDSPKPNSGYRIARLAQDLREFILERDLKEIAIGGHSMGASILWSYIEQFGADRISKFIFIDQAPVVTNGFGLEGQALKETGAAFTPDVLYATAAGVANAQSAVLDGLKGAFFSPSISDEIVSFNKNEALKMPGAYAARLLVDHCSQDWRDVIENIVPKLGKPVLVIGGALNTIFPIDAAQWIASKIPGSQLEIFSADEGGSHFMFVENPEKFNAVLKTFIG